MIIYEAQVALPRDHPATHIICNAEVSSGVSHLLLLEISSFHLSSSLVTGYFSIVFLLIGETPAKDDFSKPLDLCPPLYFSRRLINFNVFHGIRILMKWLSLLAAGINFTSHIFQTRVTVFIMNHHWMGNFLKDLIC